MTENIVDCIYRSQKFLIILSDGFLSSQWCNFETHVAQHQLTELDRDSIIIVLKENITSKVGSNLSYLLKTRTYLKWPDEERKQHHFWMKLKQSLQVYKSFAELVPQKRLRLNSM